MFIKFSKLIVGLVLSAAMFNAQAELEMTRPTLPLINSQEAEASQVFRDLEGIPFGASKVALSGPDRALLYVWSTERGDFEIMLVEGTLNGVNQFDANLGYNWRFTRSGEGWQAKRVQYQSEYEKEFDYPYERLTRGNLVLTDIGLFNESRMIDCLQTSGGKFSTDPNHTRTREVAVRTFSGGIHGMGADYMSKPGWEDIRACSPGMLTSLLYLDKERYPDMFSLGYIQFISESTDIISRRTDEMERRTDEMERKTEKRERLNERLRNIFNDLSGQ